MGWARNAGDADRRHSKIIGRKPFLLNTYLILLDWVVFCFPRGPPAQVHSAGNRPIGPGGQTSGSQPAGFRTTPVLARFVFLHQNGTGKDMPRDSILQRVPRSLPGELWAPSELRGPPLRRINRRDFLQFTAALPSASLAVPGPLRKPKLTPDEIVRRHLEAVGPQEILSRVRFREVHGSCIKFGRLAEVRGRTFVAGSEYPGTAELQLSRSHFRMTLLFEAEEYPIDAFIFDGEAVAVARYHTDQYGRLASYLSVHSSILKAGLFGGALSPDWPLLRPDVRLQDMKSLGRKDFRGIECDTLRIGSIQSEPNLGGPPRNSLRYSNVRLYFERSSGRHVGTDCGLTEHFSEFRKFEGLTLPTRWDILLYSSAGKERWEIRLRSIRQSGA